MLDRSVEYAKMADTEAKLWWYKSLHELVLNALKCTAKDSKIIDAGCGTGGLLLALQKAGYTDLVGFDLSEHAIAFCKERNLNTFLGDIKDIGQHFDEHTAMTIISNDVFYFLDKVEQEKFIADCYKILKKGGKLVLNLPSLQAFRGMHDISVGIKDRLSKSKFKAVSKDVPFKNVKETYWPFFLSPIIFSTRFVQRIKLAISKDTPIESDVEMPADWLNNSLYQLTKLENKMLGSKPWGSSLFVVLEK